MEEKSGNMASEPAPGNQPGHPPPYTTHQHTVGVVQPPQTTIIHTNAQVIPIVVPRQVGRKPQTMVCKSCNMEIETRIKTSTTIRTHLFALLLCVIGCWPCACVPYCVDSCKNAEHYCPNCNAYIGSYYN